MSFEKKNFYERLGLSREATEEQIKEAYREIARIYHPDSHFFDEILGEVEIDPGLSETDLEKFRLVTEAYNALISAPKRKKYDESLIAAIGWRSPGAATQRDKPSEIKRAPGSQANAAQVRVRVQEKQEPGAPQARVKSVAEMIQDQRAVTTAQGAPAAGRRRRLLIVFWVGLALFIISLLLFFLWK